MVRDASTPAPNSHSPNGHDPAKSNGRKPRGSVQDRIARDIEAGVAAGMTRKEARDGAYALAEWMAIIAEVERDNWELLLERKRRKEQAS